MASSQDRPHGGDGTFVRTVTTAERDAAAARLRSSGWSYPDIAAELGFKQRADAYNAVKRVLDSTVREAGDELRALELDRLDGMYRAAMAVLERQHVTVSHGKIVQHDGEPLVDDAPVLQAVDRLLRIQERRSRLLGLDAPVKRDLTLTDERARAIEALVEELGEQ